MSTFRDSVRRQTGIDLDLLEPIEPALALLIGETRILHREKVMRILPVRGLTVSLQDGRLWWDAEDLTFTCVRGCPISVRLVDRSNRPVLEYPLNLPRPLAGEDLGIEWDPNGLLGLRP